MSKESRIKKLLKILNVLEDTHIDTHIHRIIDKGYFKKYPEALLRLNYAMARFVKSELGFKIQQDDPKVFFSAKHIPEEKQITLHIRMPVKDEWNKITEFLDIDVYFPQEEIAKITKLLED